MLHKLALLLLIIIGLLPARSRGQSIDSKDFDSLPIVAWKYPTNSPIIGSPVIDGQSIFVGSTDGVLYALNLGDGKEEWKFTTYGPIRSTVCVANDMVIVNSNDGNLYSVNKNTGTLVWRFRTFTGFIGDRKYDFADYYSSTPVIHNNGVYFGSSDGRVYAVNVETGKLLWSYQTGDMVHSSPAFSQDRLFVGSFDGNLYALNATSGALLWKFKSVGHRYFPRGEVTGNPAVANNLVLVGGRDYFVYAIEQNGGYGYWTKQFPKGWALPITVRDTVAYIGTSEDKVLLAVDVRTGEQIWKTDTKFNVFGGCAFSSSMGYFGTLLGNVFGFDLKTGTIKWKFKVDGYTKNHLTYFKEDDTYRDDIGSILTSNDQIVTLYNNVGAIFSTPALSGNNIVITSADGNVYCLKASQ